MEPINRRTALLLGGAGLTSTSIGAVGLWKTRAPSTLDALTGEPFVEPEVLRSQSGTLEVRLRAASGTHRVAGRDVTTLGYNGGLPGPTLRVRPGETLRIELVNELEDPTNLHVHGLHVSPEGNGDNVFVSVEPGDSFIYEHQLPEDHPPGVYWYHPHHHGNVAEQLFGGLYGAIIVEDPDQGALEVARERVLVVSDITLTESGRVLRPSTMQQMSGRQGDLVLLNGQVAPRLTSQPRQRERWRVINACSSRYLALALEGPQLELVARDLGPLAPPGPGEDLLLAPGNRADLVVTTGTGTGALRATPYDRGSMGSMMGDDPASSEGEATDLAVLDSRGQAPRAQLAPLPRPRPPRDLRADEVTRTRVLTFQMGMGGAMMSGGAMSFTIDGNPFDAERIDQDVAAGAVEDWTIRNDSSMDHPFHLHVWPMQLIAHDAEPQTAPVWRDVVNVPARSEVTVRIAFDDFTGTTVYHCHILDHEDRGMMGVVRAQ